MATTAARTPRRILVVVRGHIGDLVQATPALHAIRERYPAARITLIANEFTRGLLDGCPYVDRVIYGFAYEPRSRLRRLARLLRLAARVAGRFDMAIALRYSPASTPALLAISGARVRAGFLRSHPIDRLLTHPSTPVDIRSNRESNIAVLEPLGIDASPDYEPLSWTDGVAGASTAALLDEFGLVEGDYVVCQFASNWGCNQLADEKWAEIVDGLAVRRGLRSVAIGSDDPAERSKFDRIAARCTHPPISLHGRTTLPELVVLVDRAALVVATDSSVTQIALAQAVPSIVMFGIEPQVFNGPLPGELSSMRAIQHWPGAEAAPTPNPNCRFGESACHTDDCAENSSLEQITPAEVLANVDRLVASTPVTIRAMPDITDGR